MFRSQCKMSVLSLYFLVFFAVLLVSCGGGGSSSGSGGTGTGGTGGGLQAVSIGSVSMTNAIGQNANLQITVTVSSGFTTAVTGTLSGLPSGVSGSPQTTMTLQPGTQTIPLSVISSPGPTPGIYTLTLTATAGSQQVSGTGTLTVTQASGGTGSNGPLAVSISSVSLTNAPGQDVNLQVTLTVPAGFTTAVTGTLSGLPSGITGSPQKTMTLLPGTQTLPLSVISGASLTPGTYTLTMTATAGTQQVSGTGTLTVTQAPAIGFSVPVNSLPIAPGQSNSITLVCVTPSGANCTLSTTITGLPSGITVSPVPPFNVTTHGFTMTFSVSSSVPFGTYPITFVGQNGSYTTTFALALIIQDGNYWLTGPNPSSLALRLGETASVAVGSVFGNPNASPNYQLKLTVSGLPGGTSAVFSPTDTIVPGQSTTLTITAAANAPISYNNSVLVTATPTDGGFVYSNALILSVIPPAGQLAKSRSDIVPTDGDIVSAVYDPVHQVVFGSNPVWNRVDVISPATKSIVRSIQVPSPNKLAFSLDGTKVVVGTNTSKAYWIDTSSLQVTTSKKFPAPSGGLSPYLQTVRQVNELSTGELIVASSTMGSPFICANDASMCRQLKGAPGNDLISVSANGAKVLIGELGSPPSAAVYDAASATLSTPVGLYAIAIDPSGTYCVVSGGANGSAISLYDTQLAQQQRVLLPAGAIGNHQVVFSPDGKTVYVVGSAGNTMNFPTVTYTIDMTSGTQLGIAPTLTSWIQTNSEAEIPYAVDNSGLIFGGLSHALAIDDSTFYTNEPLGSGYVPWLTVLSGPVNAATPVSFGGTAYTYTPDVYFGGVFAPSTLSAGTLTSVVPARSTPGPVNIKMEFADGSEGFKPWAFTYGPWLQFADSGSGASGGATASLVGMGLGSDPSKVQVSIGGASAQVNSATAFTTSTGLMPIYPFPSAMVNYVVPPGVPGTADISVTTSAGTSTLKSAMRYSQVEDYSSSDTFTAVLNDRVRNRLYLTAGNHIDVFNLASNSFSAPIVPPTLSGKSGFAGMALTPDGSKLLIANTTDGSLAVVNPDLPGSANAYPVFGPQVNGTCILGPAKVAGTSDNRALVALGANPVGCGAQGMFLYSLDLTTGVSSNLVVTTATCGSSDVTASRDGSKIVMSPPGSTTCVYDVNAHTFNAFGSVYATSAAISGDGTLVAAPQSSSQWDIADLTGAVVGHSSLPDVFPAGAPLSSSALNDSGSLMYIANGPTTIYGGGKTSSFVDVIDVNHGVVRSRIRLAENVQPVMTPMAVDPTDARIFLITDKGLTVVTVSGTPLSVGTVSPNSGAAGSLVTLRGSGFQMGMTATLNGTVASVAVVDPQTAQVTIPVVSSGLAKLILTNPDGQAYSLEGAFTAN